MSTLKPPDPFRFLRLFTVSSDFIIMTSCILNWFIVSRCRCEFFNLKHHESFSSLYSWFVRGGYSTWALRHTAFNSTIPPLAPAVDLRSTWTSGAVPSWALTRFWETECTSYRRNIVIYVSYDHVCIVSPRLIVFGEKLNWSQGIVDGGVFQLTNLMIILNPWLLNTL